MFEQFTDALIEKDGIYFSRNRREISYPEEGNDLCFQLEENSFWFRHRNNCILEAVRKYPPEGMLFDIGGGNGFVSKFLEESGYETVVLEPGLKGCLNSRKRGLFRIICSTFEDAEFREETVPAAGMFDVLEHLEHDNSVLNSLHRYMTRGGLLFITVPAYKLLWSKEDEDTGHFRRYSLNGLKDLLENCGYKTCYSTYIFSVLPLPIFFGRTLPSVLKISRDSSSPQKHLDEHKGKDGITESLLSNIWDFEIKKIREGRKVPFGGSCFVVAKKL